MKSRIQIIGVLVALVSAVLAYSLLARDSLEKAASRLSKAVPKSDCDVIWTFISEEDRKLYGMNKPKFIQFWTKIVEPRAKLVTTSKIVHANENGIEIELISEPLRKAIKLKVSGNEGEYYSPFFFSSICNACAIWDMKLSTPEEFKDKQFLNLANWYKDNKYELHTNGIDGLKTGLNNGYRSIDELIFAYESTYVSQHAPPPGSL